MLDPPGPSRAQVLKQQRELAVLNAVSGLNRVTNAHGPQEAEPSSCTSMSKSASGEGVVDKDSYEFDCRGSVALVTNTVTPPLENFETSIVDENLSFVSDDQTRKEPSLENQNNLFAKTISELKPSTLRRSQVLPAKSQIRSLRSNTSPSAVPKNKSSSCSTRMASMSANRKRKMSFETNQSLESLKIQPAKSPRNIASSVVRGSAINKRPIIHTISKRASVLHLMK